MIARTSSCHAVLLAAMLVAGCGGDDLPRGGTAVRLIDEEYSELRYSPVPLVQHSEEIDLATPAGARRIQLIAADGEQRREGLLVRPRSNDPIVSFPGSVSGVNQVTVEMRSSKPGSIEVFWAPEGEEFTADRSQRLLVPRSRGFDEYTFDLSKEIGPGPYRLRVDPLDRRAELVLKRIELAQVRFRAETAPGDAPLARKVRLGRDTREALVVPAGKTVSKAVEVPVDSVLSFAIARAPRNTADLRFRLAFREEDGAVTVLLDEELPVEEAAGWRGHALSLRALAGRSGHLEASAKTTGTGQHHDGVAFWATPVLSGGHGPRRPNVILLSLDTLGSSHLSTYGAREVADDFLTRLARKGAVFENSFAASSVTHASHGSLLTGRAPLDGSLFWLGGEGLEEDTVATELRRLGYLTAAFTGGILVTASLGFDRGFDEFYQQDTLEGAPLERSDIDGLLRRAESWIAGQPSPWFVFLHSYEVHTPYYRRAPASGRETPEPHEYYNVEHMKGHNPLAVADVGPFLRRLGPDGNEVARGGEAIDHHDVEELRAAYESEIAFLDRALERFFTRLESKGQLTDTIIVVTSDHGEAFFEHKLLEHGLLYDENLRVPLVIVAPGRLPEGVRVEEPVTALDVVPTILDLVGAQPPRVFTGRSLVGALRGLPLDPAPSYAFVPGNGLAVADSAGLKLIRRLALLNENFGRDELFDRVADPGERTDLLAAPAGVSGRLQAAAARLIDRLPGLHLSLEEFAHRTCAFDLEGEHILRDRVYAVEMATQQPMREVEPGRWSGVVRLAGSPRLIIMGRPSESDLDLDLDCGDAGVASFLVDYSRVGAQAAPVVARDGKAALSAWMVAAATTTTGSGGLSQDEESTLRSLGYIQ